MNYSTFLALSSLSHSLGLVSTYPLINNHLQKTILSTLVARASLFSLCRTIQSQFCVYQQLPFQQISQGELLQEDCYKLHHFSCRCVVCYSCCLIRFGEHSLGFSLSLSLSLPRSSFLPP